MLCSNLLFSGEFLAACFLLLGPPDRHLKWRDGGTETNIVSFTASTGKFTRVSPDLRQNYVWEGVSRLPGQASRRISNKMYNSGSTTKL